MANLSHLFPTPIIIKPVHVYIRSQQYHPFTSVIPLKTQNLAKTWPEHTPNKKGIRF